MSSTLRRLAPVVLVALIAGLFAGLGGCYFEGGPGYSADRFTYVSRPWSPKTVALIDTRTGEAVWSVDVPVGQQVVVSFRPGAGPDPEEPDLMIWEVMDAGKYFGTLDNSMPCPPSTSRLLEMSLRDAPEYADTIIPEGGPTESEEIIVPATPSDG